MKMQQYTLTKRQKDVLDAIERLTKAQGGIGPTYDEIAAHMGITCNAVVQHTKRLTARGHLRRLPRAHRSMQIIKAEVSV